MRCITDPTHFQFLREMQAFSLRVDQFPHQFVDHVCSVCGKHENEWIGGGCVEAYQNRLGGRKNPRFEQSLPHQEVELVQGDTKTFGCLVYRDLRTEEFLRVPNIHYNQPIEWRIAYHREMALMKEEMAIRFLRAGNREQGDQYNEMAKRYAAIANDLTSLKERGERFDWEFFKH